MKQCFKCKCEKPLDEFYRHSKMADGHLNKCKQCTKSDVRERRFGEARERILAYDRERASLEHRRELRQKTVKSWAEADPLRKAAHSALGGAVRSGRIARVLACQVPGCGKKPEAHHWDYSRPLSVLWLCPSHHKQLHATHRLINSHAERTTQ